MNDIVMSHTVLIWIHALMAIISFVAGVAIIFRYLRSERLFKLYFYSLIVMSVAVVGAVIVNWQEFASGAQIAFSALLALAVYMIWRALQAKKELVDHEAGWQPKYINHIGFTLISYFEGLVILEALSEGGPVWLVVVLALIGVLAGQRVIGYAKKRVTPKMKENKH